MPASPIKLTVSVVSHGQAQLVSKLLHDLCATDTSAMEVIVTINVPEPVECLTASYPFELRILHNDVRKGFGANHNAAFAAARGAFFAVVNPDIRLHADPFPALCAAAAEPRIGVAAPLVLSPAGTVEDSARPFPTPISIACKLFGRPAPADLPVIAGRIHPDWVAGMFMVYRREAYARVNGFDERYFLYYEDVDICWRLQRAGLAPVVVTGASVVHDARRESHRKLGYLRHHAVGMLRFFARRGLAMFSAPRA